MILAAGRGSRLRPLTDTLPKPLVEVAGEPLIVRHLQRLAAAGVHEVVVNLGWLGDQLRTALGDGSRFGLSLAYSEEGWPALETGGALQRARPLLGKDAFVLVNSDVWSDYPVAQLVQRAQQLAAQDLAHLVLVPNPEHHLEGDFGLARGRIVATAPRLTFSGLSVQRPQLLDGITEQGAFPVLPLWQRAIAQHRVSGEHHTGAWFDVGTPQRLAQTDAVVRQFER